MPLRKELRDLGRPPRILLLGSGGLSIGQAGEFDYSGTQAVKALREEGMDVIVVNPNIATVQTNPAPGVTIYLYPVEPSWVEKIIIKEKPDAIIAGFGGQTALNCLMEMHDAGILEKHNVLNLGTAVETLKLTEDRELFAGRMKELGMPIPASLAIQSLNDAEKAAESIGYPVIVRAAYALGGLGSGFANNREQLLALVEPALASSPQVLIEKSIKGWKEVEYEVMRDSEGNCITICNMENFDPLGIHTGDSIVVCPSQSLSDDDYQMLRNAAIAIVSSIEVVGECNVQFALSTTSADFAVIEVNARLSRSSALASKASGYPIAYIAAKVVLGFDLLELKNPVTGVTFAFFEPALDYITVKVPRWDLGKFKGANRSLGSTMKSVGEVMAIGRSFPEALQKAIRMVSEIGEGLTALRSPNFSPDNLRQMLEEPTDVRLYAVFDALRAGMDIEAINTSSAIDKWFLAKLRDIIAIEREIEALVHSTSELDQELMESTLRPMTTEQWRRIKFAGFGDEQIAGLIIRKGAKDQSKISSRRVQKASLFVRALRKSAGVIPTIKKIDTTAGEYPTESNYLYMSYGGQFNDPLSPTSPSASAVVLGGGSYRVGTSVEFDWCAVSCSQKLQAAGWHSTIINCNPETVSTDYNSSDHLYFEELTLERVLDVCEVEKPTGIIASMGGQLPNKLALPLAEAGLNLLGHSPNTIDLAEDRTRFSEILDRLGIDQPRWIGATSPEEVQAFVDDVGYPVLVRPSYVLSGAAMRVVYDRQSLTSCLEEATKINRDYPVVISEFLIGAREIELDGVARAGEILTSIVSEHVENAGVHSGDATMVVPAQKLYVETVRQVRRAGRLIAKGLNLNGPFNIQFLARNNRIRVIECNARAARSFPFVSKVVGLNLADVATDVMIGKEPRLVRFNEDELPHVGVKAAMFSFPRLKGADPVLGVEMASTGEVGCIGPHFEDAMLLAMQASKVATPKKGVLVSAGGENEKLKFLAAAKVLQDLNIPIFASKGTASYLEAHGIKAKSLAWPGEAGPDGDDVLKAIRAGWVDFVINIPKSLQRQELSYGTQIRQTAVQFGLPLMTNMEKVNGFLISMGDRPNFLEKHDVISLPPYR